jgi:uncharacterized protein YceK
MNPYIRNLMIALAIALSTLAQAALAGCGTIVTLNPTQYWTWITIYDVGQNIQMDYGWVAPHSGRKWTGGASPLPYACGSFYYVRYEVKGATGPKEPGNVPNIFDTRMRINPQLVLTDILSLLQSIGSALTCVTPTGAGACLVEWGITEGAQNALMGTIGKDSNNSVVCIWTNDNKGFYLENSGACMKRPPPGTPPKPPPPPPPPKYVLSPASRTIGIGMNQNDWYFQVMLNGKAVDNATYQKGRFYTENGGIATFPDAHKNRIKGVKSGKTKVYWDYDGKRQASADVTVR